MIFYTDRFIPAEHQACTRGPLIFIRPEYKGDKGLIEHEKVHRKQFFRTFGLHGLFYLLSKKYRLQAEVEAFKEQSKHYADDKSEVFANLLSTNYNLDITKEEALTLLRKE